MKNVFIVLIIACIGWGGYLLVNSNSIKSLDPPILKSLNPEYGSGVLLSGTAYPKAKVLVYVNDQYVEDIAVDENGSFTKTITINTEGVKKIRVRQAYKTITSELNGEQSIYVDTTAPDGKLFKLTKEIPSNTKQKEILLTGVGSPSDYITLNGQKHKISPSGTFEIKYVLQEGNNNLEFAMADQVDNKTDILDKKTILVDTTPPSITNFLSLATNKGPTEESVLIDIGEWQGYLDSVNSVAITGSVQGNIKRITVDGKNVSWDENNKIYQRLNLFIYGGLNKYKVIVEDMAGNIATGYVDTSAQRDNDEVNVNVNN